MRRTFLPLVVGAALVASACAATATTELANGDHVRAVRANIAVSAAPTASTSTTTPPTTTLPVTNATTTTAPRHPECVQSLGFELPPAALDLAARIETATKHPGFEGHELSVLVWVDGWGEVATHDPDLRLVPASNQKLLVATAANELLEIDQPLQTSIELVGDDLVIRASADPTLTFPRVVDAVESAIAAAGRPIERLIIDVSSFPQQPEASGWLSWDVPNFAGALSGFMVENNQWTGSAELASRPDFTNGQRIVSLLRARGVEIEGVVVARVEAPESGKVLATIDSAPVGSLLRTMLVNSDNQHADLLLMEVGRAASGRGTLASGADAVNSTLYELCGSLDGLIDDGSGLSHENLRSARSFAESLVAIHGTDAGELLRSQLSVGGVSGTLARRFGGPNAGRVQAKTGTLSSARSLTGWATTADGREAIFSIIVNGEAGTTSGAVGAIDALVREILATNAPDPIS